MITNERHFESIRRRYLRSIRKKEQILNRAERLRTPQDLPSLVEFEKEAISCKQLMESYIAIVQQKTGMPPLAQIDEIGAWLVKARLLIGISQHCFADALGISRQQVQDYERSFYQRASLQTLQSISKTLLKVQAAKLSGHPDFSTIVYWAWLLITVS